MSERNICGATGLVGGGGGVGGLAAELPGEHKPCGAQIHVRDVRPGQPG